VRTGAINPWATAADMQWHGARAWEQEEAGEGFGSLKSFGKALRTPSAERDVAQHTARDDTIADMCSLSFDDRCGD